MEESSCAKFWAFALLQLRSLFHLDVMLFDREMDA